MSANGARWVVRAMGLAAAGLLALAGQVQAATLFEQSPVADDGYLSSMDQGAQNADDFTIGFDAVLNRVEWWGVYLSEPVAAANGGLPVDLFTVRLVPAMNGGPDPVAFTALTGSLSKVVEGALVHFSLDLPAPVPLAGGTTHYFSVMNDPPTGESWFWSVGTGGGLDSWGRAADGEQWNPFVDDNDLAFRLIGERVTPIPEPSTVALFALGILAVGWVVRRRVRAGH